MRRVLLSVALLASFFSTEARRIPQAEATIVAAAFMNKWSSKVTVRRVPMSTKQLMPKGFSNEMAPYYVFNNDNGKGFVIVSGDDAVGKILAYSDKGHFSMQNAPDNLIAWMNGYAKRIAALPANSDESNMPTKPKPIVEPLLGDIEWGQDAPYNNDCPTYDGRNGHKEHYYVGCVATATTQIMRYHKWPKKGTGTYTYMFNGTPLTANFGETTYDWDNMLPSYKGGSSDTQEKAVSTLAAQFGIAVEMGYEMGGSGTLSQYVPRALREHFGYDSRVELKDRKYITTADWMRLIKRELDEHRPIYYAATSENGGGGHAFVCDGYDDQDFVHINWGWTGNSNGYYMINAMNPSEVGIGASASGFNLDQEMVINIKPAEGEQPAPQISILGATRLYVFNYFGLNVMTYLANYEPQDIKIKTGVVLCKDNKVVKVLKEGDEITVPSFQTKSVYITDVPKEDIDLPDGSYTLHVGYLPNGTSEWQVLRHRLELDAYADAEIENKAMTSCKTHEVNPEGKLLSKIGFGGPLHIKGVAKASVKLQNKSQTVPIRQLLFNFQSLDNEDLSFQSLSEVQVYENSEKDLALLVKIPDSVAVSETVKMAVVPGKYHVSLCAWEHEDQPFDASEVEATIVDVLPAATTMVLTQSGAAAIVNYDTSGADAVRQGENILIGVPVMNVTLNGKAAITAYLRNKETQKEYVFLQKEESFTVGRPKMVYLAKAAEMEPGKYEATFRYTVGDKEYALEGDNDGGEIEIVKNPEQSYRCELLEFPEKLEAGKTYNGKLKVTALKHADNPVRLLLVGYDFKNVQFINKNVLNMKAGETKEWNFTYKVNEKYMPNGIYMVLLHEMTSDKTYLSLAGHDNYYRIVNYGATTGIESIKESDKEATELVIEREGRNLHISTADDSAIRSISVYTPSGVCLMTAHDTNSIVLPNIHSTFIVKVQTERGYKMIKFF